MKRTVHLARSSKAATDCELFPDPESVFANWNAELAARFLPVAAFDLKLVDADARGRGVFLYYEDPAVSFLEWSTRDGRIVEFECDWRAVRPFDESPLPAEFIERRGAYLAFDAFEIDIGPPSEYEPDGSWTNEFDECCTAAGYPDALQKLRLGGGYPCYVQGETPDDGPGFIAELPCGAYDLSPQYFYLFHFSGKFQQLMDMT